MLCCIMCSVVNCFFSFSPYVLHSEQKLSELKKDTSSLNVLENMLPTMVAKATYVTHSPLVHITDIKKTL